jgi:hypothetical protein
VSWVNLDDQMPEHPKVVQLSDAAFRLHISAICYCNRYLTDGVVSASIVRRLVPNFRKSSLSELLQLRVWFSTADGDGYEIHDYLQWNSSKAEVQAHKERISKVRSEAGRRGAEARWGKRWQT